MPVKKRKALSAKYANSSWEPQWLQKIHAPAWVVLLLGVVFFLRIPAFFEPYHQNAEINLLLMGEGIFSTYSSSLLVFLAKISGNLFWLRAIAAGFAMASVFLFWKLTDLLFPKNDKIVLASVFVFSLFTSIPLLSGHQASSSLFSLAPAFLSLLILIKKPVSRIKYVISGISLGLAVLFHFPTILYAGAITVYILLPHIFKHRINKGYFLYLLIGLLMSIVIGAGVALIQFSSINVSSSISSIPTTAMLIVAIGLLSIILIRNKISHQFLLINIWLLFSFLVVLSGGGHTSNLLQSVAPISLLVGMLIASQTIEQTFTIVSLFTAFAGASLLQYKLLPTGEYYLRFIRFAGGQITKEAYFMDFGDNVVRDYKIAKFLLTSTSKNDSILIMGEADAIYALSKRKPAAAVQIDSTPKFIIVLPEAADYSSIRDQLSENYILIEDINGARIYKNLSFSVSNLLK